MDQKWEGGFSVTPSQYRLGMVVGVPVHTG